MLELARVEGFGPALTQRAVDHFKHGLGLECVLQEHPYRLTEVPGVGFKLADVAARQFGVKPTDPERISAAAVYVLTEAEKDGHTALSADLFGQRLNELLGENLGSYDLDELVIERDGLVSRTVTLNAEERIAAIVESMRRCDYPGGLPTMVNGLMDDQAAALAMIQHEHIFCLLGSPGTGKTTLIKSLIASNPGAKIELCAPTGKAAKRMEEATKHEARTIHRMLEVEAVYEQGKKLSFRFRRNAQNPLRAGLVICDESSMIDIWLCRSLLNALPAYCRLVLIGDPYQLPSVGPGRVLTDLTRNGAAPNVELTQLKRHDPEQLIARNCAEIKLGRTPIIQNTQSKDFFFIDEHDESKIADIVVQLVSQRLPDKYNVRADSGIMVVTALRERGLLSAKALNARLRLKLNPKAKEDYAAGDRVIQLSNDYDLDVMNGDIGTVLKREGQRRNRVVRFDVPQRIVTERREYDLFFDLAYAWALTVHKSQGSEWPWVVIPIHESQGAMVPDRAWLYTAISRAQQGCVLVGNRNVMRAVINRVRPQERCTRLAELLA